jgi:hypothetical protein
MVYDPDQRKAALRAVITRIERKGASVARWEKLAEVGEGLVRNFLKRPEGTMTDKSYKALAGAASKILGEEIQLADLQGESANENHSATDASGDQQNVTAQPTKSPVVTALPPLLVYLSAAGSAPRGNTLIFKQKIGEFDRLKKYEFAKNAFCTEATDDLMRPLARTRDTLVIDPDRIPAKDDDCLFVRDPDADPLDTVFRHLVEITPTAWIVCEHNGRKTNYELRRDEYPKAWPVLGVFRP